MLRNALEGRSRWSFYFLLPFLGFLLFPSAMCQTDSGIDGIVTTKSGQPIAGVSVHGSELKTCGPFKSENAATDEKGLFRLEHPGAVVHFFKQGFELEALVIPPGAIFVPNAVFQFSAHSRAAGLACGLQHFETILLMDLFKRRSLGEFRRRITQNFLIRGTVVKPPPLHIDEGNHVGGVLGDDLKQLFALL